MGRTVKVVHLVHRLGTRVGYRFQWYLRGAKIRRATRSSLTVTEQMLGKRLKVKVRLSTGVAREVVTIAVGRVR